MGAPLPALIPYPGGLGELLLCTLRAAGGLGEGSQGSSPEPDTHTHL